MLPSIIEQPLFLSQNNNHKIKLQGRNISKNNTLRPMRPVHLTHLTPER